MPALAPSVRLSARLSRPTHESVRARGVLALVISPELDVRKPLLRALEALQIDTVVCANRVQAEGILGSTAADIIFCDERLPDGTYSDLVGASTTRGNYTNWRLGSLFRSVR